MQTGVVKGGRFKQFYFNGWFSDSSCGGDVLSK